MQYFYQMENQESLGCSELLSFILHSLISEMPVDVNFKAAEYFNKFCLHGQCR